MKQTFSDTPSLLDRIRFWKRSKADGSPPILPLSNLDSSSQNHATAVERPHTRDVPPYASRELPGLARHVSEPAPYITNHSDTIDHAIPPSSSQAAEQGTFIEQAEPKEKKNIATRFWLTSKHIILSSYINILLVFVPIGIVAEAAKLRPGLIFGMNAVAIVPLAGLLSHATESVAKRMGDTIGALMNVTFGNAVELIIFMYVYLERDQGKKEREALLKALSYQSRPKSSNPVSLLLPLHMLNEIRIVQASLLGSILANLLLILGMCFLVGGLRFREQMYNSTVTQMSACLLSLSVMSLLLPTAFHASFASDIDNQQLASRRVLKVSRGTSVILLIVYALYLLFQLKSHAYMYQSTPQHIIDEELAPGPVAAWMESSDSDTSSSSSANSDGSSDSHTTVKRMKKLMRAGRRRRKSSGSKDTVDVHDKARTPSFGQNSTGPTHNDAVTDGQSHEHAIESTEDGDDVYSTRRSRNNSFVATHLQSKEWKQEQKLKAKRRKEKKRSKDFARKHGGKKITETELDSTAPDKAADKEKASEAVIGADGARRVDFAMPYNDDIQQGDMTEKRPFTLCGITQTIRPQIPKTFPHSVFSSQAPVGPQAAPRSNIPRVRYGIRRTNSLPDRLGQTNSNVVKPVFDTHQPSATSNVVTADDVVKAEEGQEIISRTTAVFLLIISTGLVAVCAEFMVDSINAVVSGNSGLSIAFVGLILLPIVSNAAEHVTAVTVASKNKMDLAIGVAVGSSIQIALFVTPFIVLLGWCMKKEMTLYFTLFETVALFVSAFIVNFLVLDGRSNYLEGALLIAAYVIIAVAAFFYPRDDQQSSLGGSEAGDQATKATENALLLVRSILVGG